MNNNNTYWINTYYILLILFIACVPLKANDKLNYSNVFPKTWVQIVNICSNFFLAFESLTTDNNIIIYLGIQEMQLPRRYVKRIKCVFKDGLHKFQVCLSDSSKVPINLSHLYILTLQSFSHYLCIYNSVSYNFLLNQHEQK